MIAVITRIELRSALKFFKLSYQALHIVKQLKSSKCKSYKNTGFWTTHYTMTLWDNKTDMQAFVQTGAHLQSMKLSAQIAKEIKTLLIETDTLPDWETAKSKIRSEGKALLF